ncbi:Fic family protein [Verrucomicrobium sp. 3C]|uniref:Fic family protein n=1 Tax=Verrucomicrobium sp. 3C TaxID=1134055 RepID=UPI0003A1AA43|nr:DUF4172 domain-containing protein [Verrucomicrobium sp. 3C]
MATTEEIVSNSQIEGEKLDKKAVRSHVARRLGLEASARHDRRAEGAAEIALDAAKNYQAPLTEERLFGWHGALFPGGYSGMYRIRTSAWRDDARWPMVIVSGPLGREKIHFQAPPASRVPKEMERFLDWFNREQPIDRILKAGLAHLWFVMIHPFEDGDGRIARTLTDMVLARSESSDKRFYSLSGQILKERKAYYAALERADRGGLDATRWLFWFLDCFSRAVDGAQEIHSRVLNKGAVLDAARWRSTQRKKAEGRPQSLPGRFQGSLDGEEVGDAGQVLSIDIRARHSWSGRFRRSAKISRR